MIVIWLVACGSEEYAPDAQQSYAYSESASADNFINFSAPYVFLQQGVLVLAAESDTLWAMEHLTGQLLKSQNHGEDWTFVYEFENQIQGIHPDGYGNLFVSTSHDRWDAIGSGEIFKSSDGGDTFRKVLALGAGAAMNWNFASRAGTVFISEYGYKGDSGNNARRIFRSLDFGETWEIIFEPPPKNEWHNHKILLAADGTLYQSIGDGENARIIRSTDGGDTWHVAVYGFHPTSAFEVDGYILWGLDSGAVPGVIRHCRISNSISQSLALPYPFNGPAYAMAKARGAIFTGFLSYQGQSFPGSLFYTQNGGESWHLLGAIEKPSPSYGVGFWHLSADEYFLYVNLQAPVQHGNYTRLFRGTLRLELP